MTGHTYPTYADATGRRFGHEEREAVERVLDSGTLWRVGGTEAKLLEEEFAAMMGAGYAVAAATGSGVIHCAVAALDLEPGDEVIVPPITDMGSMIGILAQGLIPRFADVDPATGCITAATVEEQLTDRTRAVMVVHLFGGAADVEGIVALCSPRQIRVIEDCAQAYLTRTAQGALVGTVGDIGCFSLQQSKHITTGDGGLLITDDEALARRAALFSDKGWPRDTGERMHLFLGLNYRMNELTAAVARAQLRRVGDVVADRRRVAERWNAALDVPGVTLPGPVSDHSYWLYPLILDPQVSGGDNTQLAALLNDAGLPSSAGYLNHVVYRNDVFEERLTFGSSGWPLSLVPDWSAHCPVAEDLVARTLVTVAINENFTDDDIAAGSAALATSMAKLAEGSGR